MYAMQYQITLPADYDMDIIRRRIATRGSALDAFDGLGLKAYLVRDRANGSSINQYAPFYLWADTAGMREFLWGGAGFGGIVADFGRPAVRHYTGAAFRPGRAFVDNPDTARFDTAPLPADVDPAVCVADALDALDDRVEDASVHSAAVVVDPDRWVLGHLILSVRGEKPPQPGEYEVLHLSRPHIGELA